MTVNLPDDAARRLAAEAGRRGITVDELVAELAARLPAVESAGAEAEPTVPVRRRLSFIGLGRSGQGGMSERVKELRREVAAEKLDDERQAAEG